jgi:hypothetical protein
LDALKNTLALKSRVWRDGQLVEVWVHRGYRSYRRLLET